MAYRIEQRKFAFTAQSTTHLLPTPHIHTHLEMIYLVEGCSIATLDNEQYTMKAGDIFLAFPNQIHFYHDKTPIRGHLVIFTPEMFPELKELFHSKIPASPVLSHKKVPMNVGDYLSQISQKLEKETAIDSIAARGYLLTLLAEMFSSMEFMEKPGEADAIKRLLTYCMEHYTEPLTLEHLEKELYLNKYYISHVFRERMNISYKDFITRLRIDHACDLLKKGANITEVAFASGFSSVRTFNRAFSQEMKMTPREYIKLKEYT